MKNMVGKITGLFGCCALVMLILDAKTAAAGASAGVELCLAAVIPALFPFFVVSSLITSQSGGFSLLRPLVRLTGSSPGCEPILLVGLLGGYPAGAQAVSQSVARGQLSREDGKRLLAFCSNAGPAFLFGMGQKLFDRPNVLWCLWGVQILSALSVAAVLPRGRGGRVSVEQPTPLSLPQAVSGSVRAMGMVCGWVVLFRVVLAFLEEWFLWAVPVLPRILLGGALELTNGFLLLSQLPDPAMRFVVCAMVTAFGGLCVAMQTASVLLPGKLPLMPYLLGKSLQALFAGAWSLVFLPVLFHVQVPGVLRLGACGLAAAALFGMICKKEVDFLRKALYNRCKRLWKKGGQNHAFS